MFRRSWVKFPGQSNQTLFSTALPLQYFCVALALSFGDGSATHMLWHNIESMVKIQLNKFTLLSLCYWQNFFNFSVVFFFSGVLSAQFAHVWEEKDIAQIKANGNKRTNDNLLKNVPIWQYRPSPNDGIKLKV